MKQELAKRYDPAQFEQTLYERWERGEFFTPLLDAERPKFSIVIPPPNVTGRLHIGHALVNTLQDIVVRWKRMSGYNTLWLPGTDHAGIATQMVVDRKLTERGISRFDIGREKFVEEIWKWKEQHRTEIKDQLARLGASADWTRERFTLDENLSRAVRHVFVRLYEDGLIYRDIAMVNWCPFCRDRRGRRLDPRALHAGREPLARRPSRLRAAVRGRPDLSRHRDGELVPLLPRSARPPTGPASASRWTRTSRAPSVTSSCGCTRTA